MGFEPKPQTPLISLEAVAKSYGSVRVLKDATFSVSRGEVVVLMGENGAGKSTLKNVLCGLVAPSAGRIVADGREFSRLTVQDSRALGIAAIHQELSLFPNLSVAENVQIGVGSLPLKRGLIDKSALRTKAAKLLGEVFETEIDLDQPVERLSLGERQLVEVAKALHLASAMLIFDEPTTSLSLPERRRLFDVVRKLRNRGYALIYITHFMEEVYELADRIVVLRDGGIVGAGTPKDLDADRLTALMVGRELAAVDEDLAAVQDKARRSAGAATVLRVRNLSDKAILRGVSFDLHAGEVLGIGGLMGAGRTEIAQAIFGMRPAEGIVEVDGARFDGQTPERAKNRGIALVSEDRRSEQIFPGRGVYENLTSATLARFSKRWGLLSRSGQHRAAAEAVSTYGIRHPGLDAPMASLSGGNQQKCVIARWLSTKPKVCILDEPTKGIDVRAKAEIHKLIGRLADEGLGVLLISSDLPELLALSHRILVMHKGGVVGQIERPEFDPGRVVRMASTGRAAA
jgi:ABC-type sugar transport system ATPase subunit